MVTILKYIFLGIVIYVVILPALDGLSSVIVQCLENLKGLAMIRAQEIQNRIYELAKEIKDDNDDEATTGHTAVVGFQLPEEVEYYEEDEIEDD